MGSIPRTAAARPNTTPHGLVHIWGIKARRSLVSLRYRENNIIGAHSHPLDTAGPSQAAGHAPALFLVSCQLLDTRRSSTASLIFALAICDGARQCNRGFAQDRRPAGGHGSRLWASARSPDQCRQRALCSRSCASAICIVEAKKLIVSI